MWTPCGYIVPCPSSSPPPSPRTVSPPIPTPPCGTPMWTPNVDPQCGPPMWTPNVDPLTLKQARRVRGRRKRGGGSARRRRRAPAAPAAQARACSLSPPSAAGVRIPVCIPVRIPVRTRALTCGNTYTLRMNTSVRGGAVVYLGWGPSVRGEEEYTSG
eukprot:1119426-Prorocentrum_minimum.AAC.6